MEDVVKAEFERMNDENIRQNHRIGALEVKVEQLNDLMLAIKELTINMAHMVQKQDGMQTDISAMKSDLDEIKMAPAQKWEKAVWIVITAFIGAAAGYAAKALGF